MSERFEKGLALLNAIDGAAGQQVVDSLKDVCPDMGRMIIEYAFGDVYALDGLNMQEKEIVAVAQLAALGAIPQLKVHLHGILNVGVPQEEVKEILLQMAVYCGFPKALNAIFALKEILEPSEKISVSEPANEPDRHKRGVSSLNDLHPGQTEVLKEQYGDFLPRISEWTVDFAFGDIYSRSVLTPYKRQLATVGALAALGNAYSQLKFHLGGALQAGLSEDALKTMILLTTVYAGFPAAFNAAEALREVLNHK